MGQVLTLSKVVDLIVYIVQTLIRLAYIVGIGMVIYSGIRMAVSRGDAGKFNDAKKMLLYSIIGLAVMFGTGLIVNTIAQFGENPASVITR